MNPDKMSNRRKSCLKELKLNLITGIYCKTQGTTGSERETEKTEGKGKPYLQNCKAETKIKKKNPKPARTSRCLWVVRA